MKIVKTDALSWFNFMVKHSDGKSEYWSNTIEIKREQIIEIIKIGVRVFNREPLYNCVGYPLQYFYWGDGEPDFKNYEMIEQIV